MDFLEYSYQKHAENFAKDLVDENRIRISESWFNENTADYWRHDRAYECVDHLLSENPEASWITVGDGRWGLDSIRIKKKGFSHVLPTDISEPLLKAAKDRGYISEYAVENSERLSFVDGAFDYVFCKESLHHFPRPYLALYEMLRVARRAVFCIEPNDHAGVNSLGGAHYLSFRSSLRQTLRLFFMRLRSKGAYLPITRRSAISNFLRRAWLGKCGQLCIWSFQTGV